MYHFQRLQGCITCFLCDRTIHSKDAPVAQLDRASDFESAGRRFESCRA